MTNTGKPEKILLNIDNNCVNVIIQDDRVRAAVPIIPDNRVREVVPIIIM